MMINDLFTDLKFRGTKWYLADEVDATLEAIKKAASSYTPPYEGGFNPFSQILEILGEAEG